MKIVSYFFPLCFIYISCNQFDNIDIDKELPDIEIYSPERNKVYSPADTVFISCILTDNQRLRKGSIHIHDQTLPSPLDTVFNYNFNLNASLFSIDTFWIVNDSKDKSYIIFFECVDDSENEKLQLRYFHQYH